MPLLGDVRLTSVKAILGHTDWMSEPLISYKRHRFPHRRLSLTLFGCTFRFPLSLRLVAELLLERGIVVSYETVRVWAQRFGPDYPGA